MTGVARASYRLGATLPAAKLIYTTSTTTTTTTTTTSTTSVSSSLDLAGHAHLTGHVTGSAKSRDEAMDVVVAKIISLLILTVLSVLCGLLPLRLLIHTPHIFSKNRKPVESFLCGLRLFSGGIYLATCFLHLLPDTRVKVAAVMVNMGSRSTYAIPELLVISGFYAVVFMEQIIKTLYVRAESSDTRRKKRPKRRKIREVYTSTLDERDGHRSGDRFELKDEYSRKTRSMYDDDSDIKGDDDDDDDDEDDDDEDDENNVLVDDDDDDDEYIMESDAESDRYSQRSYTCVKKRLDDKENERKIFQQETLPRTQRVYQVKSDSYSYKDLDKRNSHEYDKDFSTTVSVHVTTPTVTSSPAVILSSITPCANKTTPTPSSYFLPSSQSSTPAAFTSTTSNSKTATIPKREVSNPEQSFIFPPVSNSKTNILSVVEQSSPPPPPPPPPPSSTAHIFPSICHANNGCDNIDNTAYKQKSTVSPTHNAQIPTRFCHNREYPPDTDLIQKHQPYSREALNDDVNDKTSRTQKPIYPLCTQSSNPKGTQPLSQYPKFTEPSVQYICDDKIRIHENHVDHENRVDHESIVPPSDFLDRENTKSTCGSSRDKDNDSGIFSSKRDGDEKFLEERRRLMMTSSDNSIDRISECACSIQEFQVQQVVDELKHPEVSTSAHLRSIIYIMALAFHGIFEGMALGLQSMKNSVWALCFAIVVHRCVLAFKLGMDLCRGEEKQGTSFLCIGTFTLISALGIIIGILISSGASFYSDVSVPEAILQSLATGTIIYIVFLDILIKDLQGKDDLKRVSCTFVGFSLMAVVFAVSGS